MTEISFLKRIDPSKEYTVREIIMDQLLPGLNKPTPATIHRFLTSRNGATGKVTCNIETNKHQIKSFTKGSFPGQKINLKIYVKGEEIIKFLRINGYK